MTPTPRPLRFALTVFVTLCLCIFHGGARLLAQQVDPNLFSGMKWRMIGPYRGGKVNAVAGVPEIHLLITLARMAVACGRRPTVVRSGNPSSIASQ